MYELLIGTKLGGSYFVLFHRIW